MQIGIPSVDLSLFKSAATKNEFVQQLGQAFHETGFVAVKNHGLSEGKAEQLYHGFKKFFHLSDAVKIKYQVPNGAGQRGYTPKSVETAKGFVTPDLKEFYHIGQENIPLEPELSVHYPPNVWPDEVPELGTIGLEVYKTLEATGIELLRAIALYLGLNEEYFTAKVATGNSILRAIHYFPIENPDSLAPDAVRAAAHEDINLITLLMGASADGLQILKKDGTWVSVTALPEQIVVNVGDMLARLTNDVLKSTTHRVVNPPKELMHLPRFSMPFFMHPRADMDLTCLPSCVNTDNLKKYTDMTAGEYLDERLRELGLRK